MKIKKKLPPNRTYEQVKNHYLVERSIAKKLKNSNREERKKIFGTMYKELFRKVPDHPRLTRRVSQQLTDEANKGKMSLVDGFIDKSTVFAEFAPGDCRFSCEVAMRVKYVYGIDISDQRDPKSIIPKNFKLVIYNGYDLNEIDNNSIDIIFSDQLIEHIHPDDTLLHFKLAHKVLKRGGKYVFRAPHSLTGPHDVSQYFSDEPEGFHLKEWTHIEIKPILKALGFSAMHTYWHARGTNIRMPYFYFAFCEYFLGLFPKRYVRKPAKYLIPSLFGVAIK
jgi:SAM-dependent methyltransferase